MQKFISEENPKKKFEKLGKKSKFLKFGDLELMTLFYLTFLLKYTLQKSNED